MHPLTDLSITSDVIARITADHFALLTTSQNPGFLALFTPVVACLNKAYSYESVSDLIAHLFFGNRAYNELGIIFYTYRRVW